MKNTGAGGTVPVAYSVTPTVTDGTSYVHMVFEDLAGNTSTVKTSMIKLDRHAPTFTKDYYSYEENTNYSAIGGTVLSNKSKNLYVAGSYSDDDSGVKELKFDINGVTLVAGTDIEIKYSTVAIEENAANISSMSSSWKSYSEIADKTSIKSYRAMINKAKLAAGSVGVETADVTGNSSTQTIFTITIDETAPVLTLNTPKTKCVSPNDDENVNTVNGTITFAGTTEESSMDHLDLYWGTTSSATADINSDHLIATKAAAQSYNWSFTVPLSSVESNSVQFIDESSYAGSPKDIYLKAIAVDKAGNTAKYVYKYSVNPDDDRPIITFTQLDLTGLTEDSATSSVWLKDNKTMTGSVTDDDGVTSLKYRKKTYNSSTDIWSDWTGWTACSVTNGNFTIPFTDETKYSLEFKVTDGAGTEFTTVVDGNQYLAPKFVDQNGVGSDYSILNLAVDITSPNISDVKYIANNGADEAASTDFTLNRFGGDWKKFKLQFDAADNNGIKSAKVIFNGKEYTATNTSGHTYSTGYIPLDKVDDGSNTPLPSGNYTATIIATDNADREGRDSMKASFVVDNDAPTVRISQPNGLVSMATQAVGSLSEVNGLAHVYFMVTQKNANPVSVNDYATAEQNGANRWKEYANLETGTSSFEIAFDSGNGDNHTDLLKWYLAYVGLTTIDAINGTNGATRFTDLTEIDLHIKAVDSYGNVGYGKKTVQVDPQGDKPTVTITYPLADSTLGGAIPIMGTAIDNVSADNVMVLMDMNDDGKWNKADIEALGALNPVPSWLTWGKFDLNPSTEKYEWTGITYAQIISETTSLGPNDAGWTKYGIKKTVNNASWSFTVNQGGELNPSGSTARRNLALWVYSTDTDGNSSQINLTDHTKMPYVSFIIDKDTPQITNEYLVQYDNSGTFTESHVTAKYAYTKDMSIKGEWYYEADMTDESGLEKVTRYTISDGASIDSVEMTSAGTYVGGDIVLSEITNGYHIRMKVGSNTDDEVVKQNWKIACQESDGQHLSGESEIALNVDNKAPDVIETGDFYNIGQAVTINGDDYRKVTNENGFFTFGTQAKEDAVARVSQTGVKRIAFYFTRDINTTHQLYDVMIAKGGTGNALDGYTGLSKNDGLYWKNLTGTASGKTFTLSGSDPNVHTGGLVKIKGVIYRIEGVSGRTVTIEVNTTEENPFSGVTSAEFALANVVDNPTEENADENSGKTAGYYNHVNFDDGDLMVESLKKQGTTWTWEANINSKNIGDGKAVLHYVVFDAAGNSVEKTVDVFVANNQPRIAGVSIGTDTNGNGTVDASEMISEGYSNIYAKGKQGSKIMTEAWFPSDKASSVLKIMGNTRIKPEIVGGNGQLDYSYAAYASNGAGSWSDTPLINGNGTAIGTGSAVGTEAGETEDAQALTVDFTMAQLLGMGNAENTKFALTVSDQTPGASLSATLNIIVDTLLLDNNPPRSRILPFYWVDKDTNILFKQSRDYGHIELPVDLPDSFTEGGTGVDDRDPKLSGIVKIEGIARDDVLLSELKVKVGANEYTLGTYNGSWNVTNEWDGSTIPTGTYAARITNATYRDAYNMGFIPEADFNALSDMVKDTAIDYVTAKYGHIVHWTLYLDTASFVTGTDIAIMASASDRGRATSSAGNVTYTPNTWTEENEASHSASANVSDSGTPTGYQKVDIVPYIAKVYTGLAKLKNINWSVFNRTSLGHYAVASNETVYLYGFNLGNSTNKPKYGAVELNAPVNGGTSNSAYPSGASYASYSVVAFPVSNVTASGEITITVGDTSTLNNLNKSDAKGSYSGTTSSLTGDKSIYDNYYNRQPNGDNNNLLTDDLVLDVWDVNSKVGKPAAGALSQPVMDIDPISGKVGFAFRNGALMMSMGSQNYSYDYWLCGLDVWTSIGFVYDDLGYGWGTAAGGDINNTSADSFALISSRWGTGTLRNTDTGHNNGTNQIRPYTIGQKDYDENGSSFVNIDKERFQSPTLATTVEGTASTVYLAYYDNINNEIRFHWGTFTTNTKTASMVQDLFSDAYGKNNALNGKDITQDYAQYRLDYTSLIAGQTQNAHPFTGTPTDTRVYATDGTPVCAGQYVSIAALKGKGNIVNGVADDAVIAVWYDAANNQLLYSYNKAPKSITAGQFLQADTGWSKPVAIFGAGNGIGEYCKIAADKNGGAHIVAYDSLNADVVYAYIPSFDAPANAVTCIVDSYGLIGTELDIDVALDDDENPLPFISYYAGSNAKPKTARWSGKTALTTSNLAAGSENEMFTGTWDISLIPTNSKIAVDHINVGIWKDKSTGIIKNSTEGTNLVEQTGASYNSSVSRGNIFGNGSKNAILGYAINEGASGYIETAQMK
ncbi:MAG: hypothetical protein J6Y16_01825 [Treponema sp.]|nr:hypothetical protein [Treponema sp.]